MIGGARMSAETIQLLRERALVGRMEVQDKQLMLVAADELEKEKTELAKEIFDELEEIIKKHVSGEEIDYKQSTLGWIGLDIVELLPKFRQKYTDQL